MFINLTEFNTNTQLLINLNKVTCICPAINDGNIAEVYFNDDDYITVKETVENLYDRIRSISK